MSEIYYDDHMVGIFGMVANFCYAQGFDKQWVNKLWNGLQEDSSLYNEFIHYFNTGEVIGTYEISGYSVLDCFIWRMEHYSLTHDVGRTDGACDKMIMVLLAFETMIDLKQDPKRWLTILEQDQRMDWIDRT